MTRPPCCDEKDQQGLKKGPWTPDEDQRLVAYVQEHGHGSWRSLPLNAGLQRCGKSCRLRWTNYLRPDIKRGRFSQEEDQIIVHLHAILGNRWSAIASHLPRRTDNEIKNYWNTYLKKRLLQMGIDPVTHKSTTAEELVLDSIIPGLRPVVSSNLTHMSQWDCARAEAEARLSRQSSLTSSGADFAQSTKGGASSTFMSDWKAQVAETLRPSFGVVELDKTPANPVNLQKFLQEWESSLQPPTKGFSSYGSPIDVPDLSSCAASEAVSPQYSCDVATHILPSSAQITERLLASRCDPLLPPPSNIFLDSDCGGSSFNFPGEASQFSPKSTLHGPDHDSSYTNSPCVSNSSGDSFDLLAQSFSLIHHETSGTPSFWSRQQAAMVDALQPEPYFLPELKPAAPAPKASFMVNHVGVPNNIPIPQFDFLC